jgi:predicted helicase
MIETVLIIKDSNNWKELQSKINVLPKKQMGNAFEVLTKLYFLIKPEYHFYDDVWLLNEVPTKILEYLELPSHDLGIDLIARHGDEFHAIQCKYHSDKNTSVNFKEVSTFISLLEGNSKFTQGYICSTADATSRNLDKVKTKRINNILYDSWLELDLDFFDKVRSYYDNRSYKPVAYIPKEHQIKAIQECLDYFGNKDNTRGKLVFPCGAGKSLTGFWMTQELKSTTTIIAVPSLSLVKQTLEVYLREIVARDIKVEWLCICSDEGLGKDDEILQRTENLGVPCETEPIYIENWLLKNEGKHKIIFTTYQSGRIIADVSKKLNVTFDLGIFDEAHKTVGSNKKLFSYLLFEENISIEKRIFMTATERFYSGSKEDIISMDNYDVYGDTFSQMSFKEAIEKELLTDYKVITIDVKKSEIAEFIKTNNLVQLNNKWKNETEARSLASMIALRKAMKVLPIKNAVSFHSSIEKAERNKELQTYITDTYNYDAIDSYTVSSKVSSSRRNVIIQEFANSSKKALITNSKCLTEGVDVPNIDCIIFADPRKSKVDIVQALGRALRKKEGKEWGYVILPVIYDDATDEIDNDNYVEIISIVRGLAANDERVVEYFKDKCDKTKTKQIENLSLFDFNLSSDLFNEKELTEQLQIKIWENLSKFQWLPFEEARVYVHGLGLRNSKDWNDFYKSPQKPVNITSSPSRVYKNDGWKNLGDWLGTGTISNIGRTYLSFEEARLIVRKKNFKNNIEWREWSKNERPNDIPGKPDKVYIDWQGWGHWLGTGAVSNTGRTYLSFEKARRYVSTLDLKTNAEWRVYSKSDDFNNQLPSAPDKIYLKKWKGWENFLGNEKLVYFDYEKQKATVKKLNLKSGIEFKKYVKVTPIKGVHIQPNEVFLGNEWSGWQDFLGYEKHPRKLEFASFKICKKFASDNNIKSVRQWEIFIKNSNKPDSVPSNPSKEYKDKGWKGWSDFLGKEEN